MKRKLGQILLSFILVLIALFVYKIYVIQDHKKKINDRVTRLKNIPLVNLDSMSFSAENVAQNYSNYILIYFNSQCGHCDYQIKDLKENFGKFDKSLILLVSEERIEDIKQFQNNYNLFQQNILVGKMTSDDIYNHLGNVKTPSTFIYDNNFFLKKKFMGETKVEAFFQHLN